MGLVNATVELVCHAGKQHRHKQIDDYDTRSIQVNTLVDSGSLYLCINEVVKDALELPVRSKVKLELADGQMGVFDLTWPVEIRFANRNCVIEAVVLPGDSQCLLGVMPMEAMDVLICPLTQELVVNPAHPDCAVYRL